MDVGPFSYLVGGASKATTKVASDRLELLAKMASKAYLENGTPLNESITKIASEGELNPHQIERVCEIANLSTHQALWSKTAEKDKVAFPLADSRRVICIVAKPSASQDEDELDDDYKMPPSDASAGAPLAALMGVNPSECHHGLHDDGEKNRLIVVLQKKAAELERAKDSVLYKGMELESLEKKAEHAVKQAVLGGESFRGLLKAAHEVGLLDVAQKYLPAFQERLIDGSHGDVRSRLEKTAISKADEDLVSDNLGNVTVVNGAHPVIVCLDTVKKKTDEVRNGLQGYIRARDEVDILKRKVKELS